MASSDACCCQQLLGSAEFGIFLCDSQKWVSVALCTFFAVINLCHMSAWLSAWDVSSYGEFLAGFNLSLQGYVKDELAALESTQIMNSAVQAILFIGSAIMIHFSFFQKNWFVTSTLLMVLSGAMTPLESSKFT